MASVIEVHGLAKHYGAVTAVESVTLEVTEGEIFGLVGPNGAGKTTSIECMGGLRIPDRGEVRVLGLDPRRDRDLLNERIGIQLQQGVLQSRLKVWEALDLFACFYNNPRDWNALLEPLGLAEKRERRFEQLSGGERQRLFVALALVGNPEVVFLDEMTTGLDPQARRDLWELIETLRDQGLTIVLSTHFMEEAERLCDRVGIMDRGRLVALDTPHQLIHRFGASYGVEFYPSSDFNPAWMTGDFEVSAGRAQGWVHIQGTAPDLVPRVLRVLQERGCGFEGLKTHAPNLEDVFLEVTGRTLNQAEGALS